MAKRKSKKATNDGTELQNAEIGQLGVGDRVTVGDREGTITEIVKGPDNEVHQYRVGFETDEPGAVVGGVVQKKIEVETFDVGEVDLVEDDIDEGEAQTFEPGDQVIARGGEKGTVEKVESVQEDDPNLSEYTVQFGNPLGKIRIAGRELTRYEFAPNAKAPE